MPETPPRHTLHFCHSMAPLLRPRDLLEIAPAGRIRVGDIVLFRGGEHWTAHRVIEVGAAGIRTRGDNNPAPDLALLSPDQVAGVAVARWRRGRRTSLYRGWAGVLQYLLHAFAWHAHGLLRRLLTPVCLPHVLRQPLMARVPPRVVTFGENGEHPRRLLYAGRRPVGAWSPSNGHWIVRFPYSLIYGRHLEASATDSKRPPAV